MTEKRETRFTTSLLLLCDRGEFVKDEIVPDENEQKQ
jgi:hypothetical protein